MQRSPATVHQSDLGRLVPTKKPPAKYQKKTPFYTKKKPQTYKKKPLFVLKNPPIDIAGSYNPLCITKNTLSTLLWNPVAAMRPLGYKHTHPSPLTRSSCTPLLKLVHPTPRPNLVSMCTRPDPRWQFNPCNSRL